MVEQKGYFENPESEEPTIEEVSRSVLRLFGVEMTAYMTLRDVEDSSYLYDPQLIQQWARGEALPESIARERLQNVYDAAQVLLITETPGTVTRWFRWRHPTLRKHHQHLI